MGSLWDKRRAHHVGEEHHRAAVDWRTRKASVHVGYIVKQTPKLLHFERRCEASDNLLTIPVEDFVGSPREAVLIAIQDCRRRIALQTEAIIELELDMAALLDALDGCGE